MNESRRWVFVAFCMATLLPFSRCTVDVGGAPSGDEPPATDPLEDRVGSGSARVTGVVRSADVDDPVPLGGVRIMLGDAVTFSNVDGSFLLAGVPTGRQQLVIDGTEVRTRDGHYAEFATVVDTIAEEQHNIDRPIYLPFVSSASERPVALDQWTTVMSSGGIVFEMPPGGVRLGGDEYDGSISILTIAPERTPIALPARFEGRTSTIFSIQPAGLRFPVPVSVTFPTPDDPDDQIPGAFRSLWSFDGETGDFVSVGVGKRDGDSIETTIGGMDGSGWHLLTDLELAVRAPCDDEEVDSARACFAASYELLREVQALREARTPGARTVLGRLNAALANRGRDTERATAVLHISNDLYGTAAESIAAYQELYRGLGGLEELTIHLAVAAAACVGRDICDGNRKERLALQDKFENDLDRARANVDSFSSRFDRLGAAISPLEPFYESTEPITTDTLADFHRVAGEVNNAYDDFAPYTSPVDAYDTLVDALAAMQSAARALLEAVSVPADQTSADRVVTIQRICTDRGATSVSAVQQGTTPFQFGDEAGRLADDCIIVVGDRQRSLTSVPITETELFDELHVPVVLGLTQGVAMNTLPLGELEAGVLTADSPMAVWTFDAQERQGLHVTFSAEGEAVAALATADGVVRLARDGGFSLANLSGGVSLAIEVYATDIAIDEEVQYAFSVDLDPTLFDFSLPVTGSFDVQTRATAILFDGGAGQRVFVEKRCCDPFGTEFSYRLLGPDGAEVPRVGFHDQVSGAGNELFELPATGLYRVVLSPFAGRFPYYEMVVHPVEVNEPIPYGWGTETVATIDGIGEALSYTFAALGGQTVVIQGLSSVGLDPVLLSLVGLDGAVVAADELLFFDGSSFATHTVALPADGMYELSFRALPNADSKLGSFTFRADLEGEGQVADGE